MLKSAPLEGGQPQWYAVYTCANHEKRIAEQFTQRTIEHFLPLHTEMRRWKDRRVRLELPLFPGYIFAKHALQNRLQLLRVPGVVRLVGFGGIPAALPGAEIETLRNGLSHCLRAEPHPFLNTGERVRILRGPLAGLEGILLRQRGPLRLVVTIELILRSIAVHVDAADIRPVGPPETPRKA